jgi:DNA-directed RNA polymerase subunit RPC12/RpoP
MECQFCNNVFSNKQNLNQHQKKTKYCLKLQGKTAEQEYKCESCGKVFLSSSKLRRHQTNCSSKELVSTLKNRIKELEERNISLEERCKMFSEQLDKTQDRYDNLSLTAVSGNFENETTIEIDDDFLSDSDFTIEESDVEDEHKQLPALEVGKGFTIDHREEDGYINVTNLCKAGNKQFKHWKCLEKTRAFIRVLSSVVGIPTTELIKLGTGSKHKSSQTWVHTQVAVNISQWISPAFDVKVSGWVYEIMMTGKVDITNTTSFKKLQEENKQKSIKIQYLTKKYVKSHPRVQYKEKYVIYILTTALMKKERRYILGKATNLTSRLSVYNKSDEHEVVYYQSCGDEETMGCVETMVFQYLKEYREQANRERFNLPEKEEIELFKNIINKKYFIFRISNLLFPDPENTFSTFVNLQSSKYNISPQHKFCSDSVKHKNQGITV